MKWRKLHQWRLASLRKEAFFQVFLRWIFVAGALGPGQKVFSQTVLERELSLELDEVSGAKNYEIKIEPVRGTKSSLINEKFTSPHYTKKIPLGTYHIQTRAYDSRGVPGAWTDLGTIEIKFKAPKLIHPADKDRLKVDPNQQEIVQKFEWSSFHQAAEYQFELKDEDGKVLVTKKIVGTQLSLPLKIGKYRWRVISLLPPGAALQGENPTEQTFKVSPRQLAEPQLSKSDWSPPEALEWSSVEDAEAYQIQLIKVGSKESPGTPKIIKEERVTETKYMVSALETGSYQMSVIATASGFESSKARTVNFSIQEKGTTTKELKNDSNKSKVTSKNTPASPKATAPKKMYRNLVDVTTGVVMWQYGFSSAGSGDEFNLAALTVTASSGNVMHWFGTDRRRNWGLELRARQTNIYLFPEGSSSNLSQDPVTVADRRIGILLKMRRGGGSWAFDGLLGLGTHHYTYLIQDGVIKTIRPQEGELREYYLGGAVTYFLKSGSLSSADLTFHPTLTSKSIAVSQTRQFTLSLKFLQNISQERFFLIYGLEYFRSSVTLTSEFFEGEATTVSAWSRLAGGVAVAF